MPLAVLQSPLLSHGDDDEDVVPTDDDGHGGSDGPGGCLRRWRGGGGGGAGTAADPGGHGHGHRRLVGAALHPQAEPVRVRPQGTLIYLFLLFCI